MGKAAKAIRKIERADLEVTRAVARHRREPIVRAAGEASDVGDQPPLRALCAGMIAIGLWRRDAKMAEAGARMLASHTLATAIKDIIKQRIERTRPDRALDKGYRARRGRDRSHSVSSFPSGHTAGAVAVAEAAARHYPGMATPSRTAAAAIAAVQIPRCKHFVSDIAAGAAIGWVAAKAAGWVMDRAAGGGREYGDPIPVRAELVEALPFPLTARKERASTGSARTGEN
jgi:hypothetical protein